MTCGAGIGALLVLVWLNNRIEQWKLERKLKLRRQRDDA